MDGKITSPRDHLRELATRSGAPLHVRFARMYYGRARPLEYMFGNLLLLWLLGLVLFASYVPYNICGRQFTCAYWFLPVYVPVVVVGLLLVWVMGCQRVRRFHDLGLGGVWGLLSSPVVPLLLLLWMMRETLPAFGNPFQEPFSSWREVLRGYRLFVLVLVVIMFVVPALVPGRRKANRFDV